jgi:hypothetical protein
VSRICGHGGYNGGDEACGQCLHDVRTKFAVLKRLICEVEWIGAGEYAACPWCESSKQRGHKACSVFNDDGSFRVQL